MTKKRSEKLHKTETKQPRGGSHNLLDLAWDLDRSTPEEAWTHPWRSGLTAARLAARMVSSHRSGVGGPLAAVLQTLRGLRIASYEDVQNLRRDLHVQALDPRELRWLRAGCLILEAQIANSSGGGHLYGQLLWSCRPDEEVDGDRMARFLLDARVEDTFGVEGCHVEPLAKMEGAFREAWQAGRYRMAYLIAEAGRGVR